MVSPTDKNGGQIDGGVSLGSPAPQQAATDGQAITFGSQFVFAGGESGLETEQYLARRGQFGWSVEPVTPRQEPPTSSKPVVSGSNLVQGTDADSLYQDFTPDLHYGFLVAGDPAPAPGAAAGYFSPYVRDMQTRAYRLLTTVTPPVQPSGIGSICCAPGFDLGYAGASDDGSHIVFAANDALTPDAAPGHINLYEAYTAGLRLVSVLPDGHTDPGETYRLMFGGGHSSVIIDQAPFGGDFYNAISADGSRIFWTGSDGQLYMRENGFRTVQVSASQKTNGSGPSGMDPRHPQEANYWGANNDGSRVFFTSREDLTNDATAAFVGEDLYSYNTNSGTLTDISVDTESRDVNGAAVGGVLGSSEDGSYVYFAAQGILASGAQTPPSGDANLYVWHNGAVAFVSSIREEPENRPWASNLRLRTSRVSPNGRYLVFESRKRLTSYDNAGFQEVYEYDADTTHLVCVSCRPNGEPPRGDSFTPFLLAGSQSIFGGEGWETLIRQQRYLLDDGRVFFDSRDGLVPQDINDAVDVYEYGQGQVGLISSGIGDEPEALTERSRPEFPESQFVDASATGGDVFFVTHDRLVPGDVDGALDLYDARVGGIGPVTSSTGGCSQDCQIGPSYSPVLAIPATVTFVGSGNVTPAMVRHTVKERHRRHVICKRHRKPRAGCRARRRKVSHK